MLMCKNVILDNEICSQLFIISSSPGDKLISRNNRGKGEIKTFMMKKNNTLLLSYLFNTRSYFFLFSFCELLVIFKILLLRAKC